MAKKRECSCIARSEGNLVREIRVNYQSSSIERFKVRSPENVAAFFRSIAVDNSREHFVALYLDGIHRVAAYSIVAIGSANSAKVHLREIFQPALIAGATALALAHNHPSGDLTPSQEDFALTSRVKEAAALLGIRLLDHVIISDLDCVSMVESGLFSF